MNPQELLAQLRPPDAPEAIGWWPLAPGWWLLASLLLFSLLYLGYRRWLQQRRSQPWKTALALADKQFGQWQEDGDERAWLTQSAILVKRCLLLTRAADPAVNLSGAALQNWLEQHCPDTEPALIGALAHEQYRANPHVEVDKLQPALRELIGQLRGLSRA